MTLAAGLWAFKQRRLRPYAKMALALMSLYASKHGYTCVSESTLANDLEISDRSVRRIIADLKELGLITPAARPRGYGRNPPKAYFIAAGPQDLQFDWQRNGDEFVDHQVSDGRARKVGCRQMSTAGPGDNNRPDSVGPTTGLSGSPYIEEENPKSNKTDEPEDSDHQPAAGRSALLDPIRNIATRVSNQKCIQGPQYVQARLTPEQQRDAEVFHRHLEAYPAIPESLRPRWVAMLRRLAGKYDVGWLCWLRGCQFAVRGTTLIIKAPFQFKYTRLLSHTAEFENGWGAAVDICPPENVVRGGRLPTTPG